MLVESSFIASFLYCRRYFQKSTLKKNPYFGVLYYLDIGNMRYLPLIRIIKDICFFEPHGLLSFLPLFSFCFLLLDIYDVFSRFQLY